MAFTRRTFLKGLGAAAATSTLAPLIKVKRAAAATGGKRVVIVGIGGGLRLRESLGMAEGATMPNLFGTTPL
ncbi:MAG TPA: twin-arginine translocation signal domain-containing protein, partial [Kofleriaceae bacterium]|nr:twin-arginine translocation signal domain-containing protein [Kofleriaceae bacterium]